MWRKVLIVPSLAAMMAVAGAFVGVEGAAMAAAKVTNFHSRHADDFGQSHSTRDDARSHDRSGMRDDMNGRGGMGDHDGMGGDDHDDDGGMGGGMGGGHDDDGGMGGGMGGGHR